MSHRVGAPGSPRATGPLDDRRSGIAAERGHGMPHPEVPGEQDVWVAEPAHGHVRRCPGSDPSVALQLSHGLGPVHAGVQNEVTTGQGLAHPDQCGAACPRHRQGRRIGSCEPLDGGEHPGELRVDHVPPPCGLRPR
jgi:hypothetical protein